MTVVPILRGGISNCLFGICTAIAYSLDYRIDYAIPTEIENPHYPDQKVFYSPLLNYTDKKISELAGNVYCYYEPYFHYKEIPKFDCDFLILNGYFQSWLYFMEHRDKIIGLLAIPYSFQKGYCSIHVRRSDYLKLPNHHPVVTNEYLAKAQIEMMNRGIRKFIIVTDDVKWCKEEMALIDGCEYFFSDGKNEIDDIVLASSCEYNVGSNSSFSWFIHFLNQNKNKVGIFPKNWFGGALKHDVNDLYLPNTIIL